MNSDPFERRLQSQPLREIPSKWRSEILSKARQASSPSNPISPWRRALSTLNAQLSSTLWPSPKAWAGLASIWFVLLIVNVSTNDKSTAVAKATSRPAPEQIMVWREQERLLTELIGPQEISVADRPKHAAPGPRSERHIEFLIV